MTSKFEQSENQETEILGKVESISGGEIFDAKHGQFTQVVKYKGELFETRQQEGDRCWCRSGGMASGTNFKDGVPRYILIDRHGNVLEEKYR